MKLVNGETILNRLINQFEKSASSIIIVTGFMRQEVESHIVKKDKVSFVHNKKFKEDKNILSCFLGLEETSSASLIIEADVILSDADAERIVGAINKHPKNSFVCSQQFSKGNMKRIGCVSEHLYLLPKPNIQNKDNRMAGVFYLSQEDSSSLLESQRSFVDKEDFSKYYFTPILNDKKAYRLENFVVSSASHTVNTKEEYEWALKALS